MKLTITFFLFFVLMSNISCDKKTIIADNQSVIIKNGIVAGNINLSDFEQEIDISETTTTFRTTDRSGKELRNCTIPENSTEWNNILSKFNFEIFKKIPAINCQNCPALGDIGYEFLEIKKGTESYKIQFNTGANVVEIADLLKLVREKRVNSANNCQ